MVKFLQMVESEGRAQLVLVLTAKDMLELAAEELSFSPKAEIGELFVELNGKRASIERVVLMSAPDEEAILGALGVGTPPFAVLDRVVVRASGARGSVGSIATYPAYRSEKPQWKVGVQFDVTGERAYFRASELEREGEAN